MMASSHEEHEHGHAHGHGHHHHGVQSRHALLFAVALTLSFALVEAATGWWSGSLALLGDAGHMVTDSTALGMAALAAWFSRRPPSARHSYGFARAEVMAALLNALFMVAVVAAIAVAAVQRFYAAQPINGAAVTIVAALGLAINVAMALVLSRGEKTLNTRGALLHVMGDLLGSVAALIAGVVVTYTGWTPIDPILSLFICALILFSSLGLLREALHTLMEGVPLGLSLPAVGQAMSGVAGVSSVHDLHIWDLGGERVALSAHVVVEDLLHWETVLSLLTEMLGQRYRIEHVTLQPEPVNRIIHFVARNGKN
ncbi:cation transporter [Sulfurimicrobium lacus]|uniref:Cation transporter n=1 Tax=Sulfurimicrobium lacus TaxID=2715678 RepID=A0A6F8VCY7_9PROT|nr:cation diffusion facilitator family transporter [Sulfurimicrobium lacus]BCB26822.1 cation transporter [Sulfurimicrobium lacus]